MVATSATRDAANAADFVREVSAVLGTPPEVLSGAEEATLSFTGATAELARGGRPLPGGGHRRGLDRVRAGRCALGPSGLGHRHLGGHRLRPADRAAPALRPAHRGGDRRGGADVDAALDTVAAVLRPDRAAILVGLAGSVTTLAGLALGLPRYDSALIHHARMSAAQVGRADPQPAGADPGAAGRLPVMHPGRVDVIGGGALVLDHVMRRFGFTEVLVSEHDILDGIAWSLARGAGR